MERPAPDDEALRHPAPSVRSVLESVEGIRFPLFGSGYDPTTVDAYLDELGRSLGELVAVEADRERSLADLAARCEVAERQRRDVVAVEARLVAAQRQVEELRLRLDDERSRAAVDADALLAAARAEADQILREAHDRAARSREAEPLSPAVLSRPVAPVGAQGTDAVAMAVEAIRAIADMVIGQMRGEPLTDPAGSRTLRGAGPEIPATTPRRAGRPLLDEDAAFIATLRRTAPDRPADRSDAEA